MQLPIATSSTLEVPSTPPSSSPDLQSFATSSRNDEEEMESYINLLTRLNVKDGEYYLGKANLLSVAEYRIGGREGNILVVKGDNPVYEEFVMRGVFEIERRDFYMTSDANFDPANDYRIKFETLKATCQLALVRRDGRFSFSITDYTNVINNLRALENLVPKSKAEVERLSVVSGGTTVTTPTNCTIKLSHLLFSPKPDPSTQDDSSDRSSDTHGTEETTCDLATWPVNDRCIMARDRFVKTHVANPLPAYGMKGSHIPPEDYEKRLSGAVVEAHFGLVHHYIRSKKHSVFTTVLRELNILHPPVNTISSPMKKRRRGQIDESPMKRKMSH